MIVRTTRRIGPRLARLTMPLTLALALPIVAPSHADDARPTRLAIEPNAILEPGQPLAIEIEGIKRDARAHIWVVQDCDQDRQPDDTPTCPRLHEADTPFADDKGLVSLQLDLGATDQPLPHGVPLWLRAARPGATAFRQVVFGLVEDECTLFQSVVDAFLGGRCDPGLAQVLRHHRQPSNLEETIFEVRRIDTGDPEARARAVPNTRGATGAAWLDPTHVLVTGAGTPGGLDAGLYRFEIDGEPCGERLWRPDHPEVGAFAPLAIDRRQVAFVTQAPGPQRAGAQADIAHLLVLDLEQRMVRATIPLPYKIHQLLRASADGRSVLALSLGVADNRPVLLTIDLTGDSPPSVIGFSNALYQSAMASPDGLHHVVAFENAFGNRGWQIALADGTRLTRDQIKRDGLHDLAPAWHPAGGEIVYLAQVGGVE